MIILRDTREKSNFGWDFPCEVKDQKLDTGDYTIQGYEKYIVIERKCSPSEIAQNLGVDYTRFEKELIRLKEFPLAYLICEFPLSSLLSFPKNCNIPKSKLSKIRINGKYLTSCLASFENKYGVQVIYTSGREEAMDIAFNLFNLAVELKG